VGNAISTLHAIKVFCVVFSPGNYFGKKMRCFEDVFHVALMNRLHMENSRIYLGGRFIFFVIPVWGNDPI